MGFLIYWGSMMFLYLFSVFLFSGSLLVGFFVWVGDNEQLCCGFVIGGECEDCDFFNKNLFGVIFIGVEFMMFSFQGLDFVGVIFMELCFLYINFVYVELDSV